MTTDKDFKPAEMCKNCGNRCGSIKLTIAEEIFHFGHVLTDAERGYCSQKCQRLDASPSVPSSEGEPT